MTNPSNNNPTSAATSLPDAIPPQVTGQLDSQPPQAADSPSTQPPQATNPAQSPQDTSQSSTQPTQAANPAQPPQAANPAEQFPMRLQKYLARAGVASRRGSENLMTAGQVTVNGQVVKELGYKITPGIDLVRVNDVLVQPADLPTYLMLHKPAGYLTTMDDPQGRPTVRQLIPFEQIPGLFPVGRLDNDTTGLLLFMTDGELAHRLLHPCRHVPKRYRVIADGQLQQEQLDQLRQGIVLNDGITLPAIIDLGAVSKKPLTAREKIRLNVDQTFSPWQTELYCTITEGRKRQVKRMFTAIGHPVIELSRIAFGPLELADLPQGSWRYLSDSEVQQLKDTVD